MTTNVMEEPLLIDDKCKVKWRDEDTVLDAVVIERRPVGHRKRKKTVDLSSLKPHEIEYYVHYVQHDRRLDEWVTLDRINSIERAEINTHKADNSGGTSNNDNQTNTSASATQPNSPPADAVVSASSNTTNEPASQRTRRRSKIGTTHAKASSAANNNTASDDDDAPRNLLTGGNWHGTSGDPSMAAFEREHEEATKVKNIETIVMGEWQVEAWYYSPFPAAYCDLETLYVCEYCLTYMKKPSTYKHHVATCQCRHPPGKEIYRHDDLAVYEIDGKEHRAYCQKLCLLAKLFLDHKTLYFETSPFLIYVVTTVDEHGAHIVGYFSKEKNSSEGYNLACILTFPQYQKCGYGKFIISLSYELTKREEKTGSPEKPLSDLGKVSYRSYWTHVLMHYLHDFDPTSSDTDIHRMSRETGIKTEDLISTLQSLDMIKVWKGQHAIYVKQDMIRKYMKKGKKFRLCNPKYLKWEPPLDTKENA